MFLTLLAAAVTPAPLPPLGKWQIDYGENTCVLSRQFGTDEAGPILAIRTIPYSETWTFMLAQHGNVRPSAQSRAKIIVAPGGSSVEGAASSARAKDGGTLLSLTVEREDLGDLVNAATITIAPSGATPTVLRADNIDHAVAALAACQDGLLKRWNIDPVENTLVKRPARGIRPETFISYTDYPTAALAANEQGISIIYSAISVDGRVDDCRVAASSGSPRLDFAACEAIKRRGRYRPALGQDDKPMRSHQLRQVVWSLPTG